MSREDKRQRHKAKREAKRREARRQNSVSPIKRLADADGQIEYWMSDGLFEDGQTQVYVYKRAVGLCGLACFLIDRGVVGLKDAYYRLNIDPIEFADLRERINRNGVPLRRAALDEIRALIAGAIRWTSDNGLRLPTDWQKPASIFGGVGDWKSADVSKFVMEFQGHPEDLRQRLIGDSFENYVMRTDVEFLFSSDAPYMDQKTGEYENNDRPGYEDESDLALDEDSREAIRSTINQIKEASQTMMKETADWLATRDQKPSPELQEVWGDILFSGKVVRDWLPPGTDDRSRNERMIKFLDLISGRIPPSRRDEYEAAMNQVMDFIQSRADSSAPAEP